MVFAELGTAGVTALADGLRRAPFTSMLLISLKNAEGRIEEAGARALAAALPHSKLTRLGINNITSEEGRAALQAAAAQIPGFRLL